MEDGPVLEGKDLWKTFQGTEGLIEVLKGLDLCVYNGEVVAIVGPSGVGKSTLLHILGSLDAPDRGEIRIKGKSVFGLRAKEVNKLRNDVIGFIFQFHYLLPDFTAIENVMMPALVGGKPLDKARKRAQELLEEVGLADRLHHKPSELSGGEQQRVAVARAFANNPEIILADEPTGNLDEETSAAVNDLMLEMAERENMTFVVVTHNREFSKYARRILLLKEGTLHNQEE